MGLVPEVFISVRYFAWWKSIAGRGLCGMRMLGLFLGEGGMAGSAVL